jgi:hypothetical protein
MMLASTMSSQGPQKGETGGFKSEEDVRMTQRAE